MSEEHYNIIRKVAQRAWRKYSKVFKCSGLEEGDLISILYIKYSKYSKEIHNLEAFLWKTIVHFMLDSLKYQNLHGGFNWVNIEDSGVSEREEFCHSDWEDMVILQESLKDYPFLSEYLPYNAQNYSLADFMHLKGYTKSYTYSHAKKEGLCFLNTRLQG